MSSLRIAPALVLMIAASGSALGQTFSGAVDSTDDVQVIAAGPISTPVSLKANEGVLFHPGVNVSPGSSISTDSLVLGTPALETMDAPMVVKAESPIAAPVVGIHVPTEAVTHAESPRAAAPSAPAALAAVPAEQIATASSLPSPVTMSIVGGIALIAIGGTAAYSLRRKQA